MTLDLLFDHFDQLITRPEDIPRLNGAILQLAVQGKLLPQNPTDEPASELLKRIRAEKDRLLLIGQIRRDALLPPVDEAEIPFELPNSWVWVRLQDVYDVRDGTHDSPKFLNRGIPFITSKNLKNGRVDFTDVKFISEEDHQKFSIRSKVDIDDILFAMIGSIGNPVIIEDKNFSIKNVALFKYHSRGLSDPKYLFYFLQYASLRMKETASGGVQSFVSLSFLRNYLIPLPPLAEQIRIVAKVESLLAQTRALAAELAAAKQERARLNRASLHHLLAAPTPTDFAARWHFVATYFDGVTADLASVDELKQTILQLAVQGQLDSQEPADEPASELVKRIEAEKWQLIKEKKIKKPNPLPPISEDEMPYDLPAGWAWSRLEEICVLVTDGTHYTPKYVEKGMMFLSAKNVKPYQFMPEDHLCVSYEDYLKYIEKAKPELNDILLTRVGAGIGEAAIIDQELDFTIYVSLALIKPFHNYIDNRYLLHWLNSPEGTSKASKNTYGVGTSQGNLNLNLMRGFVIPLPPLAEQKRIVAKVECLLKLCDELKAGLVAGEATRVRLLESVLYGAVNGVGVS